MCRRYGVLQAIFAFAVDSELLAQSPCRGIKLPPVTSTRRRKLTDDEVDAIAIATDPRYRAMVWIGAVLGLRWSEVAGLRVRTIDFLARMITVAPGGTVIRDQKGRPQIVTRRALLAGPRCRSVWNWSRPWPSISPPEG